MPGLMQPQPDARRRPAARHAFSLIEILVVVSIIALLVGLLAVGFSAFRTQAHVRQTMGLLQRVHSIATEYQATTGQVYDPADDGCGVVNSVECFVQEVWNLAQTEQMTRNLGDFLRVCELGPGACDYTAVEDWRTLRVVNNEFETPEVVVDPWNRPLRYFPRNVGDERDPGMPTHPRPYFASGGPQGWSDADDNLYSFDLD